MFLTALEKTFAVYMDSQGQTNKQHLDLGVMYLQSDNKSHNIWSPLPIPTSHHHHHCPYGYMAMVNFYLSYSLCNYPNVLKYWDT